jgi:TRAP-type transport system periplasmic protein
MAEGQIDHNACQLGRRDRAMKKLSTFCTISMAFMIASLVFVNDGAPAPAPTTIELKFTNSQPPNAYPNPSITKWTAKLAEMTAGRVKIKNYPGESLGKMSDFWAMLNSGVCDISYIIPYYYPGELPSMEVTNFPFVFPPADRILPVIKPIFDKYLSKDWRSVKVLWLATLGTTQLHMVKKSVKTLEDLKGMQIRSAPGLMTKTFKALGAVPAAIPAPEVYNALERGMVDGCSFPFSAAKIFKLQEVTKSHTVIDVASGIVAIAMNLNRWNQLPPDIQKVFLDLNSWAEKTFLEEFMSSEEAGASMIKAMHGEIINLPPEEKRRWTKAVEPLVDDETAKMEAKGIPCKKIIEEIRQLSKN